MSRAIALTRIPEIHVRIALTGLSISAQETTTMARILALIVTAAFVVGPYVLTRKES